MKAYHTKHHRGQCKSTLLILLVSFVAISSATLFVSSLIDFGRNQAVAGQRLVSDEPYGDYLASFRKPAADRSATERALFKKLAGCKVPTPEAARGIAFRNVGLQRDAQESIRVAGLIRLGRNVPGFGEKGDFVWIVRFYLSGGISEEIWVSATSGAVISVLSECQTAK